MIRLSFKQSLTQAVWALYPQEKHSPALQLREQHSDQWSRGCSRHTFRTASPGFRVSEHVTASFGAPGLQLPSQAWGGKS